MFEETYAEERDAHVSQPERRARWLFDRITLQADSGPDDQRLADNLGVRLAGSYRPVAALLHEASAAQHLRLAGLLRDQGALAVSEGAQVVGLTQEPVDIGRLGFRGRLVICDEEAVGRAALSDVLLGSARGGGHGPRGRPPRADRSRRLHHGAPADAVPRLGRRLEGRVFAPMVAAEREDLVRALELLASNGFERSATASALPVHRNTLVQCDRPGQGASPGSTWTTADDRVTIWLAARARAAPRCARCTAFPLTRGHRDRA